MLRAILCASLSLLLFAGFGFTAQKGKGRGKGNHVHGKVQNVDTSKGTLTVTLKKQNTEKEITLGSETKVVTFEGDKMAGEYVGKAGLGSIKVGDRVVVQLDTNGAATRIAVNPPHKKKPKN